MKPTSDRKIRALLGVEGHTDLMSAADLELRIRGLELIHEETGSFFDDHVEADLPIYHLTFAHDLGLMSERSPIMHLKAFKRQVDYELRKTGLSALAVLEVQALTNYPARGEGGSIMLNAQVLAWGSISPKKMTRWKNKIKASPRWPNSFGADSIDSRLLTQGTEEAQFIAGYATKAPTDAKFLAPTGDEGKLRFRQTLAGYRPSLALRVLEGLSQVSVFDLVFSVGEGKWIRSAWKRELVAWHLERSRRSRAVLMTDVRLSH